MIKLSKKWWYALKWVFYLAKNRNNWMIRIKELAKNLSISESFLRKIIFDLEKKDIVKSIKWRNWWIIFNESFDKISIYDILQAVWEDLSITDCTSWNICKNEDFCNTTKILKLLQKWFNSILKFYTLDKIIK